MSKAVNVQEEAKEILVQWYNREVLDETPVVRGSLLGLIFGLSRQHAVTINGTVHLTRNAPDLETPLGIMLLGHELYHVVHQMELGWWRYLVRYLVGWRPSHVSVGRSHPMEGPAYERGDQVWWAMHPPA